ncbi:hypothetical protein CEP51_016914 [Fusarium floridanum]|uniref:Uncharacterized protein n=1 Tax=Fusarium floridanum TaxID=1325733 RepID=A0A428NCF5_9HYPO|nr:hypothetical protein CEP51_016914 [Fusarium floridanum]
MVDGNWRFRVYGLPPPAVPARCYPDNLRWATPYVIGENPPPGRTQSPGSPQRRKMHLPASPARRPRHPGLRGAHCDDAGRIIYKQEEPCPQEPHRTYPYYRLPYGPPPSVSHQNYSRFTGGVYETPQVRQGNPTRVNKGTSRKRASIACQACRSRKVGRKVGVEDLLGDTGD